MECEKQQRLAWTRAAWVVMLMSAKRNGIYVDPDYAEFFNLFVVELHGLASSASCGVERVDEQRGYEIGNIRWRC
jgi:hypothetical protein